MNAKSITSIGQVAGQLQRSPSEITRVAHALGIEPALTINGIRHYADGDVERIAEHFRNVDPNPTTPTPTSEKVYI